ncbi:amidophosphoribosyltransferase [Salipiger sp.]|uniref:amidophosphoribosyltransferase n=1 Tax=Salipiger sp. TaxID=2078585 RepID=UPI003A986B43
MAQEQTPANVAQTATQEAKLPRRGVILLGTFGSNGTGGALLRLSDGRTARVTVGDSVGSARVVAIDEERLALSQNGRAQWISVPQVR